MAQGTKVVAAGADSGGDPVRVRPPFDFSDAFYLANGINPANIVASDELRAPHPRKDLPPCASL